MRTVWAPGLLETYLTHVLLVRGVLSMSMIL